MPHFKLQVVDEGGTVLQLPAGGALEAVLVESLAEAITSRGVEALVGDAMLRQRFKDAVIAGVLAHGVGVFQTEAKVAAAVQVALTTAFAQFYGETQTQALQVVRAAVASVFQAVKQKTIHFA